MESKERILYLKGEKYQQLIDMLNTKAIYSRNNELVSFHCNIEPFEELDNIKRPVSDGYCYLSSTEESTIRRCFCKMKDGSLESLEDVYFKYYPTIDNGISADEFLEAIDTNLVNRRNSKLYTI